MAVQGKLTPPSAIDNAAETGGLCGDVERGVAHDRAAGPQASAWCSFAAPRSAPPEVIQTLNTEINAALADPKIKARFADLSATPLPGSPAEFGEPIAEEVEKWGRVTRVADIKPD